MAARTKKPPKPKNPRVRKPPKPKKPKTIHLRHSGATAAEGRNSKAGAVKAGPVSGARPALDLSGGSGSSAAAGLGGFILDLAGEGKLGLSHAFSAWQREQDRIVNRAWRRPGGLQRMGGL